MGMLPDLESIGVNTDPFMSVNDAAAVLRVDPFTVRRWIRAGMIPAYGPRSATRVRMGEVLTALRYVPGERTQGSPRNISQRHAMKRYRAAQAERRENSAPLNIGRIQARPDENTTRSSPQDASVTSSPPYSTPQTQQDR